MNDRQALTGPNPREVHDFWPRVLASPVLGALVVNLSGLIDHSRHSTAELVAPTPGSRWSPSSCGKATGGSLPAAAPRGLAAAAMEPPRRAAGAHQPLHDPGGARAALDLARVTGDPGTRHTPSLPPSSPSSRSSWRSPMCTRPCSCCATGRALACAAPGSNRRASQTELESLGREVDPHFLFNNLNALAHLVDQRSDAATGFIRT